MHKLLLSSYMRVLDISLMYATHLLDDGISNNQVILNDLSILQAKDGLYTTPRTTQYMHSSPEKTNVVPRHASLSKNTDLSCVPPYKPP